MLQTLDDTQIRVLQSRILSNNDNLNFLLKAIQLKGHPGPINHTSTQTRQRIELVQPPIQHGQNILIRSHPLNQIPHICRFLQPVHRQIQPPFQLRNTPQMQLIRQNPMQFLLHQQQRHVIDVTDIMDRQDALRSIDVTKAGNLALRPFFQNFLTPAKNDRGTQPQTPQIPHSVLRGFRLLFFPHDGHEGHEREAKVGRTDPELELTQRLEEDGGFDVSHRPSHFDQTNVGHFVLIVLSPRRAGGTVRFRRLARAILSEGVGLPMPISLIVHRDVRHLLDPALDLVRDVRDDLDGFAEVVAATFFGDDLAVDFAGGDVVVGGEGDGEEAFVVSEVEVRFSSVVEDEALSMLERAHGPGIHVQVGIDLDGRDAQSASLKHSAHGGDGDSLAEAGDDSSGDYDVFHLRVV
mmetsp:Transcript_21841/g.45913  ORF Transcript_21841/g.45913 Transcript_21841/m.45913 type:complete len:408 (+) Transcript_21841:412-1635(+)